MKKKTCVSRKITAALLACAMALSFPCLVSAESAQPEDTGSLYHLDDTAEDGDASTYATNLIQAVSLDAHWEYANSSNYNRIIFSAETIAATNMDFIGFKRIAIEQFDESDPNSTWTEYEAGGIWGQHGAYDAPYYSFNDTQLVDTGYVYRVVAYHYAEKSTVLWFKDTQTYKNISDMMWP